MLLSRACAVGLVVNSTVVCRVWIGALNVIDSVTLLCIRSIALPCIYMLTG